ncbi:SPOR domain-containing protein [Ferrimonas senticii]|uniref:SPOR domain-containing protein n=1 Tax=Ferrimonas senticii TaxID=394566 RepID=UPI000411BA48|nr:SPOR domain-containing protein [Ferrimonas senticii]
MRIYAIGLATLVLVASNGSTEEIRLTAAEAHTFSVHSHQQQLPQPIVIYRYQEQNLIPLQAFAAALGLDIRSDAASAKANGWIGGENSNFLLDIGNLQARRGIEQYQLRPQQPWARDSVDLYVSEQLLQQILPLQLSFNKQSQQLLVSSEMPLPAVDKLLAQQANNTRLGQQQNFHSGGFDPIHPHAYQDASQPVLFAFGKGALVGDDLLTQNYQLGLLASGDLAGQSYEISANKMAKQRSEYRLRLSRDLNDLGGDLPVQLGQYQLGDVSYFGDNLSQGANEGVGVQIGDARSHQFGLANLEGNAPPGWQVHLYRNGVLLAITETPQSGRYRFLQQPLLAGANTFEMHLYGSKGEYQVRRQTINNSNQTAAGQFSYNLMAIDNRRFVANDKEDQEVAQLRSLKQHGLRLNYGISHWWDIGLSLQQQTFASTTSPNQNIDERYFGINSSLQLWDSNIELEALHGADATAYFAGASRALGDNYFLRGSYRYHDGMQTDQIDQQAPLQSAAELWLEGQTWQLGGWQYAFGAQHQRYQNDALPSSSVLANRLSSQLGNFSVTHTYLYDGGYQGEVRGRHQGKLLLATSGYEWGLSSNIHYQIGEGLRDFETRLRWRPFGDFSNHTRLFYDKPFDTNENRWGMAHEIAYRHDWLTVGLEGGFDDHGDWQINATATMAYNYRDNRDRQVDSSLRPQLADISVRVYRDVNNNGHFDRTDEPLTGIVIDTSPSWPRQVSDHAGIVNLQQVPTNRSYQFAIDPKSLPAGMVLRSGVMGLVPLAGQPNQVDLALVNTSSIAGQLRDQHGQVIGDLELNVTDLNQQRLRSVRSDTEGRFQFSQLRPGQYYLMANPEQLRQRQLRTAIPLYPLNISASGEQRRDWAIQLLNDAQPQPVTESAPKPAPATVSKPQPQPAVAMRPPVSDPLAQMADDDVLLQVAASQRPFPLQQLRQQYPQLSLNQVPVKRAGKPTYLLLAGQYPNALSAQRGARQIPNGLSNGQPMPRRVADLRRERIVAASAAIAAPQLSSEDWLAQQPADHFTWQVVATKARASAEAFVRQQRLPPPWQISEHNGWYQVLWGSFADRQTAEQQLQQLPQPLAQPWLRPFSAVR